MEVEVTTQARAVRHTVEVMVMNQGRAVMQVVIVARQMGRGKRVHAESDGRGGYIW